MKKIKISLFISAAFMLFMLLFLNPVKIYALPAINTLTLLDTIDNYELYYDFNSRYDSLNDSEIVMTIYHNPKMGESSLSAEEAKTIDESWYAGIGVETSSKIGYFEINLSAEIGWSWGKTNGSAISGQFIFDNDHSEGYYQLIIIPKKARMYCLDKATNKLSYLGVGTFGNMLDWKKVDYNR